MKLIPFFHVKWFQTRLFRYGFAAVASALIICLRYLFSFVLGIHIPYLVGAFAVVVSALAGGIGPGIFSTIISVVLIQYFLISPHRIFSSNFENVIQSVLFVFQGIIISFLIEHLRKSNVKLSHQREEYKVTLSSIGDAVIATDGKGNITFMNEIAEKLTGWTLKEAYGQTLQKVFQIINEHSRKNVKNPVASVFKKKSIVGLANHTILVKRDGSEIPIDDSAAPIRGKDGNLIGAILVFRDISEKRKIEKAERFLLKASEILNSSLDYQTTLKNVAKLMVPHLADWCLMHILQEDQTLCHAAIAHKNPARLKWAREFLKKYPFQKNAKAGIFHVLKTRKSELYPDISESFLKQFARDAKHLEQLKKTKLSSLMIVPICRGEHAIGTITFALTHSQKHFGASDLTFAEEIACRAAQAIENARLYEAAKEEIEKRKKTEEELQKFHMAVEQTSDTVFITDKAGIIQYVNPAFLETTGYTLEESLGQTPRIIKSGLQSNEYYQKLWDTILSGKTVRVIVTNRKKNGELFYADHTIAPLRDSHNNITHFVGMWKDITERILLEKRRDEFVGIASHELKTPLTSMKIFAQILQKNLEKRGDKQPLYFVNRMSTQIGKLITLVNDLLNISKIQTGKLELRSELFDLDELITQTIIDFQHAHDTHQIIKTGKTTKKIYGDRDRLEQVLINLITNAIKYSPKSDKIIVSSFENQDTVTVSVRDFGISIPKEHYQRIFERFYRISNKHEETTSGLGIGLYISSEIIKRHKGAIWVESKKGKGSTFYFSLPINYEQTEVEKSDVLQKDSAALYTA